MSKNEVKPEAAEPYTEKTSLGGPIPRLGTGPSPCRLQLSHEVLKAAGMWPSDVIEVSVRGEGEILVRRIGAPKPHPWDTPRPTRGGIIDDLMAITEERLARQKFAREGGYLDVDDEEPEQPLSDGQLDQEEL